MEYNFDQFENDVQEKPINLREVYEKYIVYWKWILASVLIACVIGFFYLRTQPYTYHLTTTLLVVDQSKSGAMNEMSMMKQLDVMGFGSSLSMVNNENEVLKSSALMKRVVNQLELHTTYTTKDFLRTIDLYTASPYYVKMDSMALMQLEKTLSFEIAREEGQYTIEGEYNDSAFSQTVKKLPAMINTPAGPISIALRKGLKFLPQKEITVTISNPNAVGRYISANLLTTEVSKQVDVINIGINVSNEQKGKDILNTLSAIYNRDAIEQINRSAMNTANFIDDRLRLISGELSDVEGEVENYKQVNQMTDISSDAKIYLERNNEFDQQRIQVENQLSLIRFVEEFISKGANQYALIPNLGLTDVGLVAVIQKYNELLMNRERIAGGSSEENPALRNMNQQIVSARRSIQVSIANSRKGLEITKRELDSQNQRAVSKIRDLPRQEREFIEIKRQQQVKESLYLFLLQKREEASLTMAITVPKGRVLNTPDTGEQTGPRSKIIMGIFFLLGLAFPLLIIFLRDLINTTISNRAQVEKLSDVPVLSELGHNNTGQVIIDHASNTDSNAELFRLLRTKLQFTLDYPSQKVMMVTSTEPGEGKSYVSLNLAISLSLTGKKVMLMGLDLRKPQLKKHLNLDGEEGMSSILSGHVSDYRSIIQHVAAYPTLDVIPGGVIPPNPNELLMSKRLDDMVEKLRNEYDYIVIDTAPVGAVSDSFLIDRVVDIAIYMCRMDYSDKRNIEFLNHVKADKTLKRPYLVINDVNMQSKYYYHRGYSYGYGNYYGHKKKNE
ncbi:MAG: polysaccharide biosynthesis tyrosine autokinase [Paludibacter sp.]|nr:polysaccharide biosynthesis tyrosine autokinase [Paludibacter sp.]